MKRKSKFTPPERDLLASFLAQGVSKSECARRLNRPRQTVVEEVGRNGSWLIDKFGRKVFVYVAIAVQAKAERRKQQLAHNKEPLKNPKIYRFVTRHLRKGWSPEQIAGWLKENHKDDDSWHICHETIYQWVFDQPENQNGKQWFEYLRRKQKKRKKQKGRTVHRSHIPDRISIHERPEVINNRTEFGHWEGDTVEGKGRKDGLHTEVERMSRKIKAAKVAAVTSEETVRVQEEIFSRLPEQARKSTTLDNGRENHLHAKLRGNLGMMTFHADPYCSGQRGTNEHGNWHLRYYFPKGTDFKKVTNQELQAVVKEINSRPRKILGFKTANEVYYQLLKKEGV